MCDSVRQRECVCVRVRERENVCGRECVHGCTCALMYTCVCIEMQGWSDV